MGECLGARRRRNLWVPQAFLHPIAPSSPFMGTPTQEWVKKRLLWLTEAGMEQGNRERAWDLTVFAPASHGLLPNSNPGHLLVASLLLILFIPSIQF